MTTRLFVALLIFAVGLPVAASDAYFVRFSAIGGPGSSVLWADDVLFYNANSLPVSVHFRGVSNGAAHANTADLVLASRQTTSLRANNEVTEAWAPNPDTVPLWILHLDIPTGVIVESRDEFYFTFPLPGQMSVTQARGKVSMPVFRELVPANEPQVQLGTDLSGTESRINVGVYNAGGMPANATIQVRRACDDSVVATRMIVVPTNTVVQSVGVALVANSACSGTAAAPWTYTVTTTVDQPSLTFVSNLNDNIRQPANEAGILPIVGLAVTKNERF